MRAILLYENGTNEMVDIRVPQDDNGEFLWPPYYDRPEWIQKIPPESIILHRTFKLLYVRRDGIALYQED